MRTSSSACKMLVRFLPVSNLFLVVMPVLLVGQVAKDQVAKQCVCCWLPPGQSTCVAGQATCVAGLSNMCCWSTQHVLLVYATCVAGQRNMYVFPRIKVGSKSPGVTNIINAGS